VTDRSVPSSPAPQSGPPAHRCRTKTEQPPEQEQAEAEQAAAYAGALVVVHQAITSWLESTPPVAILVSAPLVRKRTDAVFGDRRPMLDDRLGAMTRSGAVAGRSGAARRFGLDITPEAMSTRTENALREMAETASEYTHGRQSADIADAIADAYRADLSPSEIGTELRENVFPPMRSYEARRVAHTEVHAGAERGKIGAFREADVNEHRWLSAFLPTSRIAHMETSGQVREVGGQFSLGGQACRFPGDPALPMRHRVNCYCATVPYTE